MMNKRLFILLVILMSLSLIGIIFVQAYFINKTFQNEEKQFTLNVKRSLSFVSKAIEKSEFDKFDNLLQHYLESVEEPDTTQLSEIILKYQDEDNNETVIFRNSILEETYKVPSLFFDIGLDSISLNRVINRQETEIYDNNIIDGEFSLSPIKKYTNTRKLEPYEQNHLRALMQERLKKIPVYKRTSKREIEQFLRDYLKENGVNIDFEYAIYDKDLATKIKSENFERKNDSSYGISVFLDNNNQSNYILYVNFPNRNKFLFSSIMTMLILSIVFTSIIIIAYSSSIYQLIKQRRISQIKTDFINNMTHEFKTPIATINLALDAVRNPKVINDKEKVERYLKMIKDENKRMHAQVENVLRISKLEKNELNISKERLELHDIIEDAITHIQLIVEDKKGYVKTHLDAQKTSVLANASHFTNVIVNILDNAVKYSNDEPKIDVYTENIGNNILLKITDQGNGMSKQVQKRVFEKFYREHTGDVHNVKGHGLGLAYVKRIVEDHQGHISVESEKGKGSTFTIKLPLIS